jgi:hypothetical protein
MKLAWLAAMHARFVALIDTSLQRAAIRGNQCENRFSGLGGPRK